MIYGYARVSTRGQQRDGNSLEDQQEKLKGAGCQQIVIEQYTGTTTDRPQFTQLIESLEPNDTLVVTKLDRFARNASDGSKLAKDLMSKGIKLNILNMGMIDNTSIGRLILNVLLSFAEFERDMIVERTQEGKAIARQTKAGYREGRKPIDQKKKDNAVALILSNHSYSEASQITGLSKSTIIRAMRAYRAK